MKTKFLSTALFLFTILQLAAQTGIKKGDKQFDIKNYSVAAMLYEEGFKKLKDKEKIKLTAYRIGECYRLVNRFEKANKWFKIATQKRYKENDIHFKYGTTLMMDEEYKTALKMFKAHLKIKPNDPVTKKKIASCNFVKNVSKTKTPYEFRNLHEINTIYNDFAPVAVNGKVIYTSSRFNKDSIVYQYTGTGFENLYETQYLPETQIFDTPIPLAGYINTPFNNGQLAYDSTLKRGYYMVCNGAQGTEKNCNIYVSDYDEETNEWSLPSIFEHNSKEYSSGHPTLTPDGNTMYFVSNNPQGLGGTDIWKTTKTDSTGGWSQPVNLGSVVNTSTNEMFPYALDKHDLYFSSDGHVGFGGLDIYYCETGDTSFSEPKNMLDPFNSSADDFGLTFLDAKSGLFSSNRKDGVGEDDIYYFKFKNVDIIAQGYVIDGETGLGISDVILVLTDNNGNSDTVSTDANGKYEFTFLQQDMDYYNVALKDSFLIPEKKHFNTYGIIEDKVLCKETGYDLNFKLVKIVKDKEYEIKNIYYDLDRYTLRPISVKELDNVVNILNNNPEICIQINSHTDTRATHEYNIALSDNRAKSVVDYLISQGVSDKRLSWKGWGETKLSIVEARTEEEHQANRRTTFTIVNIDELELGKKADAHTQMLDRIKNITTVEEPKQTGIYFRIQIAAARTKCNAQVYAKLEKAFPNMELFCTRYPDAYYRYTASFFLTLAEAERAKTEISKHGYNCYVVAYENGVRIPLQKALRKQK